MKLNKNKCLGRIEVICGSMFSGKTDELIKRIEKASLNNLSYKVFKPLKDSRNPKNKITSHSKNEIPAQSIESSEDILLMSSDFDVIGIDEGQFFDSHLVKVCNSLANRGKRVIVSGLDMDYSGIPFGPIPNLMACAEKVTKLHAICNETGRMANFSFRKSKENQQVLIGEKNEYEALSREAFNNKMKKRKNY
tara:strand:- start:447 stop:1025 length:579 start_codon:yes stop_codon:yes gene_type:complete